MVPCGVRLGPRGKGSMRKNLTKRRKRHERYFNETAFISHRFAKKQKALENAEEKSETAQKEDEE